MLLRRTKPKDLEAVVGVEESEGTAQWFSTTGRDWHEEVLADPDQVHLIFLKQHHAEEETIEELVGFAVLGGLSARGPIELRRMAISPMQRHKGYGRQLLVALLRLLAEEIPDRDLVWLSMTSDNEAAQQFYESVGFELGPAPPGVEPQPGVSYMHCEL